MSTAFEVHAKNLDAARITENIIVSFFARRPATELGNGTSRPINIEEICDAYNTVFKTVSSSLQESGGK